MVTLLTKQNVKYSLRNLWMRKTRSLLTILSIFIGITTIFIFVSFGWGLYDYINQLSSETTANKFMVQGKGMGAPGMSSIIINDDDLDVVKKTNGVTEALGMYMSPAEISKDGKIKYVFLSGFDQASNIMDETMGIKLEKGRKLDKNNDDSVLLGHSYLDADKVFAKPYALNDKIEINGQKLKVIGFYSEIGNPSDDSNIYMTEDGFKKLFPEKKSFAIIFGSAEITQVDQVVERVQKNLRKHRDEDKGKETFSVESFASQIAAFSTALNFVIGFIILIALISVVVSAINTANTMVTSVLERVREIGIIKSIGAKNAEIFNIFVFESSFLGFIGGVVGIFLGWIFTSIAGQTLKALGWGFLAPHYSWTLFIGCVAFATIVGTISGVAPAINAARRRPVDALREE